MSNKIFQQPSVMNAQTHFSQIPSANIPRSTFDRSHAHKTTYDAGKLIPVFLDEVLPGDTHVVQATQFSRLATPIHPIMDNIYQDIHFWFVPSRLLWTNFVNMMGERDNPDDDPTDYTIPQTTVTLGNIKPSSVLGYFGIPHRNGVTAPISVSALPIRAYNLIWNEWYRDENLQNRVVEHKGAGPDNNTHYHDDNSCLPRGKRKDYFTSCLPWPQKGDPVVISLGDFAPVSGIGFTGTTTGSGAVSNVRETGGTTANYPDNRVTSTANITHVRSTSAAAGGFPEIYADLSQAAAVSINDLRTAFQVQRLLERDARGGTRYIEHVFAQFGVRSDDARLQRPEYLGGGSSTVNINPVANTAGLSASDEPQGNLAAFATGVNKGGFSKSFTEHGYIIGLASVRADLTYQQGINRAWFREIREDFYLPALAHLGEQAVLNREIYAQGTAADTNVFGYQERFAEYRYKPSMISGLFASEQATSLDVWHLSQEFASLPHLNGQFIEENPPIDRVIAVPSEPHFIADFWFKVKSTRPMPVYSEPGLIDHF